VIPTRAPGIGALEGQDGTVIHLAFTADGSRLFGTADATIHAWKAAPERESVRSSLNRAPNREATRRLPADRS
jgi:hypothetical protein